MKSVYIHIPFCKSICSYCDFCKVFYDSNWVMKYLRVLKEEMKDQYMGEEINSIYIGGGTPSCLSIRELVYLLDSISLFHRTKTCEFTFECNLSDLEKEKLTLLKQAGVTRLSIGIESFQEKKLKLMGRKHTLSEAEEKIKLARFLGFQNISIDLIYGFYNETIRDLKKDVKEFLSLKPDHISTYSLMIEEHTLLHVNKIKAIDDTIDAEFYDYICKKLKQKKYHHYEISNFAKPGFESIHNLNYWNNEEYYGFGLSSAGYIDGIRYTNTLNLAKYLNHENDGKKELLTPKDIMDNEIMLGLRKTKGIHLKSFKEKYGIDLEKAYPVIPLLKNKDLIQKEGYIYVNPAKLYVMNEILIKLI